MPIYWVDWLKKDQPDVFGRELPGFYGKALFPRIAAQLNCGIVADASGVTVNDGAVVATKAIYGGKGFADYTFSDERPMIVTLRAKSVGEAKDSGGEWRCGNTRARGYQRCESECH